MIQFILTTVINVTVYFEIDNPETYTLQEFFAPSGFGLILQDRSPIREEFNDKIKWVLYYGLYDFWLNKHINLSKGKHLKKMSNALEGDDRPITVYHLEGAFAALGAGFSTAFVIFLFEKALEKYIN